MSYSLKYYPDPGIAFDISKMLLVKLNAETTWASKLTSLDFSSTEMSKIQQNSNLFPTPDNRVLLFSFIPPNKNETFLSYYVRKMICEDFSTFTIEHLISSLSNSQNLSTQLCVFYFNDIGYTPFDLDQIIRTNKNMPDKIKLHLLSFIMNPSKYIDILVQIIDQYSNVLRTFKDYTFPTFTIPDDFINSIITNSNKLENSLITTLREQVITFSICYTIPDFLCYYLDSHKPFLITAFDTLVSYNPNLISNDISNLCSYANALSDINRASIIRLLLSHHSLSLQEISQHLSLSHTATYHHISILKKANMLSIAYNGRTIYYSFNPLGLRTFIDILSNIYPER